MDGQTDGWNCDSICALSIYAVARKNAELVNVGANVNANVHIILLVFFFMSTIYGE